jgi:hypothetical protein
MSPTQFATYDPASSSWRMSGDTYLWDSGTYSGIWPVSGMTRNGVSFELPQPAHLTDESGCSSLLPTPTVGIAMGGSQTRSGARNGEKLLPGIAKDLALLPTPVAAEGTKASNRQNADQKIGQVWLTNVAHTIAQRTGGNMTQRSGAGKVSPAGQLPGQLSLLDVMEATA